MGSGEKAEKDLEFKWNGNCHELSVQKEFFTKIREGIKTVEGRAGKIDTENNILENYREKETSFKAGHKTRFTISGNEESECSGNVALIETVTCEITRVEFYETFEEMLAKSGLSNCLPGIQSMEEGVRIYRSFSGYQEREEQFGVVGIHVKLLK